MSDLKSFLRRPHYGLLSILLVFSGIAAIVAQPLWWGTGHSSNPATPENLDIPPVTNGNEANNKGPANIGQAKHMARSVLLELRRLGHTDLANAIEGDLVGETGNKPITNWDPPVGNVEQEKQKAPLLIGQLKAIAHPFYNHLNELAPEWVLEQIEQNQNRTATINQDYWQVTGDSNYTEGGYYPWNPTTPATANRAIANIGQLKVVFSLRFENLSGGSGDADSDGIPDVFEQQVSSQLLAANPDPAAWGDLYPHILAGNLDPLVDYTQEGIILKNLFRLPTDGLHLMGDSRKNSYSLVEYRSWDTPSIRGMYFSNGLSREITSPDELETNYLAEQLVHENWVEGINAVPEIHATSSYSKNEKQIPGGGQNIRTSIEYTGQAEEVRARIVSKTMSNYPRTEHYLEITTKLNGLGPIYMNETESVNIREFVVPPFKFTSQWIVLSPKMIENFDHRIELIPVAVAVDADRNGEITFDGKDKTTAANPYRFWINDDRDIGHTVDRIAHFPGDWEEDDVNSDEQTSPDCDVPGLKYRRDLEDLTRLWIDFSGISNAFQTSGSTVALKVRIEAYSGTPKVNLFQPVEPDGGREFLKDEATGYKQLQGIYGQELCRVTGPNSVNVPRRAWESLPFDRVVHFLFEGAKEGDGELIFELWKDGQKLFDLPPVILRMRKANDFYETWTVGDVTSPEITDKNNNYSVWPASSATMQQNTGRDLITPEKVEEKDYIMFVHGWNLAPDDKTQFADTMFKRLWHQGFKGRFGAYRWPTFFTPTVVEMNNFNGSEERAWSSAAPLAALLQNRSTIFNVNGSSRVRVYGHSLGNIVCSEALRSLWPNAPVHTYVSGQAALAAHCWDEANPRWMSYGAHWSNTANIYRGYWQSSAGADAPHKWEADSRPPYLHSSYMPSAVKYVNHYNIDDWGLNFWELNQKLKPAIGYHYGWVPGSAFGSEHRFYKSLVSPTTLLCPGDRFQIFSWASEARSFATGAEPLTDGVFSVFVDLKSDFGFDSMHKGHSAQFRSTVQKRWSYWTRFLNDNNITSITP